MRHDEAETAVLRGLLFKRTTPCKKQFLCFAELKKAVSEDS